jgi:hypothetical protein
VLTGPRRAGKTYLLRHLFPKASAWLDVLETTGHIVLVPPYVENLDKRLGQGAREGVPVPVVSFRRPGSP